MKLADTIIRSNAVFTANERTPFQGGVAIKDNRMIAVGNLEEIAKYQGEHTAVYEYEDQLIMPGFIDPHLHLFFGAIFDSPYYLDLSATKSEEECVRLAKEFMKASPEIDHIIGWGWFLMNWNEKTPPSKASLDAIAPDIPLYMFCADGHTCWLNSKALEMCNITKDTKVSFGGIGKDKDGELDGRVYEIDALRPVMEKVYYLTPQEWDVVREKLFTTMAKCGITSIADLSVSPSMDKEPAEYERLLKMREEGTLTTRVHLYPSLGNKPDFTIARKIREKYVYDDLKLSGLKQFVDGTTSLHSACMLEPYEDKPEEKGYSNYTAEIYKDMVSAANKEGFDVKLHCIGDKGIRIALDCMEASNLKNDNEAIRNSIEHCESIHPDDIPRFAALGAIASMQPTHLVLDENEKVERVGRKRARYEWPHRSLLDTGATLAFGTDYPVYELNPMKGIHAAITRCKEDGTPVGVSPQEKITLTEALAAYTKGGACSLNREKELGTLEAGKLADLVVLNSNPFQLEAKELPKVTPILTIMNGNVVYKK